MPQAFTTLIDTATRSLSLADTDTVMYVLAAIGLVLTIGGLLFAIDGDLRKVAPVVGLGGGSSWMAAAILYESQHPSAGSIPAAIKQGSMFSLYPVAVPVVLAVVMIGICIYEWLTKQAAQAAPQLDIRALASYIEPTPVPPSQGGIDLGVLPVVERNRQTSKWVTSVAMQPANDRQQPARPDVMTI